MEERKEGTQEGTRAYELARHKVKDARVIFSIGGCIANKEHYERLSLIADMDMSLSKEDKKEIKEELNKKQKEEFRELANWVRELLGSENILGYDSLDSEGMIFIEYDFKATKESINYLQHIDEVSKKKYILVK